MLKMRSNAYVILLLRFLLKLVQKNPYKPPKERINDKNDGGPYEQKDDFISYAILPLVACDVAHEPGDPYEQHQYRIKALRTKEFE